MRRICLVCGAHLPRNIGVVLEESGAGWQYKAVICGPCAHAAKEQGEEDLGAWARDRAIEAIIRPRP